MLTEFPITGTAGKKKAETNTQAWARRLLCCGPTQDLHVTYIHIHISIYLHNPTQDSLLHRSHSIKKIEGIKPINSGTNFSEHLPLPHWILRVPYTGAQRHPENAPALELAFNSWQETRWGLWKCSMLLHKSYRLVVAVLKRVPWKGNIMNLDSKQLLCSTKTDKFLWTDDDDGDWWWWWWWWYKWWLMMMVYSFFPHSLICPGQLPGKYHFLFQKMVV